MDYGFTEEQKMLQSSARDFFAKECPRSLVRKVEEEGGDYPRELYGKMKGLGWFGLLVPQEYGGLGCNETDATIFSEEAGRAMLPGPFLSTVAFGVQSVLTLGSETQKKRLLPVVAEGKLTLAAALREPEVASDYSLTTTSARVDGDDFIVEGTKTLVSDAHCVDYLVTLAKTDSQGLGLLLVDRLAKGVTCAPGDAIGGDKLSRVAFDHVRVPREYLLGGRADRKTIQYLVQRSGMMICAQIIGMAEAALEMSIEYAKERIQFNRAIGSFQALQHKMSDMALAIEGIRWLVYYVAWLNSTGQPCGKEMAMAQLKCGEMGRFVLAQAEQIHGGMGIMREHDLTFYFRRVEAAHLRLGHHHALQESVAQALGL